MENLIGTDKFNKLNNEERNGLLHIYNVKSISKAEYAKHFKLDDKKAQRQLRKFKQLGLVDTQGATSKLKYIFHN